jgi:hypothetical protein
MNNCNACSDFFSVGCFGHCDNIETGFTTSVAGVHTIVARWIGSIHKLDLTFGLAEQIIIPSGFFNEDGVTFFTITDPNGADFIHTVSLVDYTCFKVRVRPTFESS